jgi:hypothetical protein
LLAQGDTRLAVAPLRLIDQLGGNLEHQARPYGISADYTVFRVVRIFQSILVMLRVENGLRVPKVFEIQMQKISEKPVSRKERKGAKVRRDKGKIFLCELGVLAREYFLSVQFGA